MHFDISPLLRRSLDAAVDELATEFRGVFSRETVAWCLEGSAERIGERPDPVSPGRRYLDWPVADPAGQPLAVVREIRYELYHHVWGVLEALVPTGDLIALHRPIGGQS